MFDFLSQKFSSIFNSLTGQNKLSEKNIEDTIESIKESLLEADVPHALIEQFVTSVKSDVLGQKVIASLKPGEQFVKVVHDRLLDFLGGKDSKPFEFPAKGVVMVMGLQGSGKTTSVGKMALMLKKQANARILLASVDFYRPAAIDQLQTLANKVGVVFYRSNQTNAVRAAQDIYAHYKQGNFDYLFLDTAGRLHIDSSLLQELREIDSLVNPSLKFLVLDSMTGQESLNVAQAFEQGVGFGHAILTKMDSDTRGGAAFSFRYALNKPIIFVGVGEKMDDFEPFHPDRMASRILGMGDVVSLAEKANSMIKEEDQERVYRTMMEGKMTLADFADQLGMMNKLGSLTQIMKYLPGMGGAKISPEMLEKGEQELKRFRAIISSMTQKERVTPRILDGSRKKRIALGAGVQVTDVNQLLARFEQTQQFAKMMKGSGRFPRLF
jgi:signal recognition particle subunit SRP54